MSLLLCAYQALSGLLVRKRPELLPCVQGPFPKRCGCGRVHADGTAWARLEWCGFMDDGEGGLLALRHCSCRSTLSVAARFDDAATRVKRASAHVIVHEGLAS